MSQPGNTTQLSLNNFGMILAKFEENYYIFMDFLHTKLQAICITH